MKNKSGLTDVKFGWKKEPADNRDFISKRHLAWSSSKIPSSYEIPQSKIYNQGPIGSCTANAGATCLNVEIKQNSGLLDPSRLFLYYNVRKLRGWENEDSGAYIRDIFKTLNRDGCCQENLWPYRPYDYAKRPDELAYSDAKNFTAVKYAKVEQNREIIQRVLMSGAAVEFGFLVFESFMGSWHNKTGKMPLPKKREELLGGHAVAIIGWNNRRKSFLIQNSWGEDWGLQGKYWMPYTYVLNSDFSSDFWCLEELKSV